MNRKEYFRLTEEEIGEIYHEWVKENGFVWFTTWESKVLSGEITLKEVRENV